MRLMKQPYITYATAATIPNQKIEYKNRFCFAYVERAMPLLKSLRLHAVMLRSILQLPLIANAAHGL